ncbi:unnamed protein product [Adineta steineri]|uniref:Uncharacterized protein n=1 Tax=Adineta steineri TaxID=433720 RepID=A0A819KAM2_9BILA|nr:unnamed protein product [Adineta steineri]CAF3942513.1 unnamed protein product [Adineta steineri]
MAESCSRPQIVKIVLGLGCVFGAVAIVCLVVGGPLYIQERSKVQFYTKDSCRVLSASYETIRAPLGDTKAVRYEKSYAAVLYVELAI